MPELTRGSVGLPWIGEWRRGDGSVALKHKVMLGVISAMLGALLPGCTTDKHPSREETTLANAAKDVTIPLEAGKKTNPLPETDEVVSQGQDVFLGSCAQCRGSTPHQYRVTWLRIAGLWISPYAMGSLQALCNAGEAWPLGTFVVGRSVALWRRF